MIVSGCAHSQTYTNLAPGDAEGAPSLAVLPEVPLGGAADTRRTHQGLVLADRALQQRFPMPPEDRRRGALQTWLEQDVVSWLVEREQLIEHVGFEFGMDGRALPAERILGFAVLGLLREDTARALRTIPAPTELASVPEIEQMFHEVVESHAVPFLSAALLAFRSCSDLALEGPESMQHFAPYCDRRFRRLRDEVHAQQALVLEGEDDRHRVVQGVLAE